MKVEYGNPKPNPRPGHDGVWNEGDDRFEDQEPSPLKMSHTRINDSRMIEAWPGVCGDVRRLDWQKYGPTLPPRTKAAFTHVPGHSISKKWLSAGWARPASMQGTQHVPADPPRLDKHHWSPEWGQKPADPVYGYPHQRQTPEKRPRCMEQPVVEDLCRPIWDTEALEHFIQDKIREKTTSQGNNQVLQAFRIFDKGGSDDGMGEISPDEFSQALQHMLMTKIHEEEVRRLFDKYDTDGGGTIDIWEFIEGVLKPDARCHMKIVDSEAELNRTSPSHANRFTGAPVPPTSATRPAPKLNNSWNAGSAHAATVETRNGTGSVYLQTGAGNIDAGHLKSRFPGPAKRLQVHLKSPPRRPHTSLGTRRAN